MSDFIWHKTIIATEEHNVHVYPTECNDGIIVETFEIDDKKPSVRTYLNKDEMEMLIVKMREMMNYIEQQKKISAK